MSKYRVVMTKYQIEEYYLDEVIEARSAEDAMFIATENFNFDPSPYATGNCSWVEPEITVASVPCSVTTFNGEY